MINTTEKYGLYKPNEYDYFNVDHLSENSEIIDVAMGGLQEQIDGNIVDLQDIKSRSFGTGNVNLYVNANTGDDDNDGSQTKPFKTISKAVNSIYNRSAYYTATIYIAEGTYSEKVSIPKVIAVTLVGSSTGGTIINGNITIGHAIGFSINKITINIPTVDEVGINITSVTRAVCTDVIINGAGLANGYGIIAEYSNVMFIGGNISNVRYSIYCRNLAYAYAKNTVLGDCYMIAYVLTGSSVCLSGVTKGTYSVLSAIEHGGIFTDNTLISLRTASITN